jgi:hypothetical protein
MGNVSSGCKNYEQDKRIKRYREMAPWLKDFDELTWFNEAIDTKVLGLRDTELGFTAFFTIFEDKYYWKDPDNRDQYHWYRFQEAVKDHERLGISLLKDTFAKMGKDIATL